MCGRYITVSKTKYIERKYNVKAVYDFLAPNYNVAAGNLAPVITCQRPNELQAYCFGYAPSWGDKRMYVINARSEGDRNKDDDPGYTGPKDIISKPMWKSAVRKRRCLVIADAFIEGTTKEKLKKPYLVYMRNKVRAFAFAGIYNDWINEETGEIIGTFAIITTVANKLMQEIGHHRSPVILPPETHAAWLKEDSNLQDFLHYLRPVDSAVMNAYPISPQISNPRNNTRDFIEPIGNPVFKDYTVQVEKRTELEGMGSTRARKRKNEDLSDERKEQDDIFREIGRQSDFFDDLET